MRLLDLFREPHNMDTMQIAEHMGGEAAGWTEARVYNVIAAERREERTPVTWKDVKPQKKVKVAAPVGRIRYAGSEGRQEWDRV